MLNLHVAIVCSLLQLSQDKGRSSPERASHYCAEKAAHESSTPRTPRCCENESPHPLKNLVPKHEPNYRGADQIMRNLPSRRQQDSSSPSQTIGDARRTMAGCQR